MRQRTQAQHAHQPLHDADQHRHRQRQLDIGRTARGSQGRQHGEQRQRIRVGRARHHMAAGPEQCRDDTGDNRGIQPVFGGQSRQHGECHPLGQHQQRAQQACRQVGAQGQLVDVIDP
ncbi:hypothetical protein G6F35_018159 [Rhizopus arrhizus]|nr:hypothetical protein G6F35_018159 [Rhizopus arrhizus]